MSYCNGFEIIEKNEVGVVAMCDQCDHLHIEIKTFTAVVSQKSFQEISTHLTNRRSLVNELVVKTPTSEKILVPVADNIFLSLNRVEFIQVVDLFEIAIHMLKVRKIISI